MENIFFSNTNYPNPLEVPPPFREPSIKPVPPEINPIPQAPIEPS